MVPEFSATTQYLGAGGAFGVLRRVIDFGVSRRCSPACSLCTGYSASAWHDGPPVVPELPSLDAVPFPASQVCCANLGSSPASDCRLLLHRFALYRPSMAIAGCVISTRQLHMPVSCGSHCQATNAVRLPPAPLCRTVLPADQCASRQKTHNFLRSLCVPSATDLYMLAPALRGLSLTVSLLQPRSPACNSFFCVIPSVLLVVYLDY